jgi:carnitine O-palmitoyltransferase 1
LLINSNYYGLGWAYHIPTPYQTARAAVIAHYFAHFKILLESERLSPTTLRGHVPICMRQYERMFGLTRVPGRDSDVLYHSDSVHIAVCYKGRWWRVDVLRYDKKPLSMQIIQSQLDWLMSFQSSNKTEIHAVESKMAGLTALPRTRWAEIREDHLSEGLNKVSLEEIESAMFCLHLDDRAPSTWSEAANLSLHGGGGTSWWCDKSFNIIVFANGDASMHIEHSWADAPTMAHAWEWVLAHENQAGCYDSCGRLAAKSPFPAYTDTGAMCTHECCSRREPNVLEVAALQVQPPSQSQPLHVAPGALGPPTTPVLPVPLNWHLNEQLVEAISDAERAAEVYT